MLDSTHLSVGKGCIISFPKSTKTSSDLPKFTANVSILKVSHFKDKLPESWVKQSGIILALHDNEACAIHVEGKNLAAIDVLTWKQHPRVL
jgi:hypothetical protein